MCYNLKILLRNLRRGGIYSWINVGGLAIGMAAAILIFAWIYHEWSYDRFHTKEKQLYVVYNRNISVDGVIKCSDRTSMDLGATLQADFPEIAGVARMRYNELLFAKEASKFKIKTCLTDPDFLTMFDFPLLQGSKETALDDPYSVILTEQAAIRLFGDKDPLGETVLVGDQDLMTVSGVMKDLPANTLFDFEALIPNDYRKSNASGSGPTLLIPVYVELQPNIRPESVNESLWSLRQTNVNTQHISEVFLYPLSKQHLYANFVNGIPTGSGLTEKMRLFGVIAGLILLIACINFTNLSIARSRNRAKEIGVRKVMGGKRGSLIGLFLKESTIVALVAGAIALVLAVIALPVFETLIGQRLALNLHSVRFWLAIVGFCLFTGLLAGCYPAFHLSSFLPIKVLKGIFKTKQSQVSPQKVLVTVQFTVACALIISTLVIHRQIKYAQDRQAGYDKDQLIYSYFEGELAKNYELIRQDLLNSGTAVSVAKISSPITTVGMSGVVEWQGKDPEAKISFDMYFADAGFCQTMGATIIEGRDIDIHTYPTDSTAILLNESAVSIMNFENPIGKIVATIGKDWHVVGVVKDMILRSPYEPVSPLIIGGPGGWFSTMHIKLNGKNRMTDNLARVEQIFKQYNPAYPFVYNFIDEEYARKFQDEQKTGSMVTWFAGLAIFISCMGLFALVAYMAETRHKEIGIRKVLGASVSGIMLMLSKEFLILVVISVAVASPIAWWAMNKWLTGYAYRTNIPWWLFIAVGCLSEFIALITVGFQAIRAATANPVESIKSE
jgi:ABC-type antimicrobial peptide transport system permease subunit